MKIKPKTISVINLPKRAFSLLELLVAIGVLSAGLIFILQALSFCARSSGVAADTLGALALAENKLQELQYRERNRLLTQMNDSGASGEYRWDYALEPDPSSGLLYKCSLNVTWERSLRSEKFSLAAYLRR